MTPSRIEEANRYAALGAVLAAVRAVHDEDAEKVTNLLSGMDLNYFIRATLGLNELLVSEMAQRLNVRFDVFLDDLRLRVLEDEHAAAWQDECDD